MKIYHKNTCVSRIRQVHTTKSNKQIILFGKHAFEWGVAEETNTGFKITILPNRTKAVNLYKIYQKL